MIVRELVKNWREREGMGERERERREIIMNMLCLITMLDKIKISNKLPESVVNIKYFIRTVTIATHMENKSRLNSGHV
jgi:hypothetical protein